MHTMESALYHEAPDLFFGSEFRMPSPRMSIRAQVSQVARLLRTPRTFISPTGRGCILRSCQTAQEDHQEEEVRQGEVAGTAVLEELVVEEDQEALAVEQDVLLLATNREEEEDRGNKEELAVSKRRRKRRSSWTWQSLWTRRSGSNFKVVEKVSDCVGWAE